MAKPTSPMTPKGSNMVASIDDRKMNTSSNRSDTQIQGEDEVLQEILKKIRDRRERMLQIAKSRYGSSTSISTKDASSKSRAKLLQQQQDQQQQQQSIRRSVGDFLSHLQFYEKKTIEKEVTFKRNDTMLLPIEQETTKSVRPRKVKENSSNQQRNVKLVRQTFLRKKPRVAYSSRTSTMTVPIQKPEQVPETFRFEIQQCESFPRIDKVPRFRSVVYDALMDKDDDNDSKSQDSEDTHVPDDLKHLFNSTCGTNFKQPSLLLSDVTSSDSPVSTTTSFFSLSGIFFGSDRLLESNSTTDNKNLEPHLDTNNMQQCKDETINMARTLVNTTIPETDVPHDKDNDEDDTAAAMASESPCMSSHGECVCASTKTTSLPTATTETNSSNQDENQKTREIIRPNAESFLSNHSKEWKQFHVTSTQPIGIVANSCDVPLPNQIIPMGTPQAQDIKENVVTIPKDVIEKDNLKTKIDTESTPTNHFEHVEHTKIKLDSLQDPEGPSIEVLRSSSGKISHVDNWNIPMGTPQVQGIKEKVVTIPKDVIEKDNLKTKIDTESTPTNLFEHAEHTKIKLDSLQDPEGPSIEVLRSSSGKVSHVYNWNIPMGTPQAQGIEENVVTIPKDVIEKDNLKTKIDSESTPTNHFEHAERTEIKLDSLQDPEGPSIEVLRSSSGKVSHVHNSRFEKDQPTVTTLPKSIQFVKNLSTTEVMSRKVLRSLKLKQESLMRKENEIVTDNSRTMSRSILNSERFQKFRSHFPKRRQHHIFSSRIKMMDDDMDKSNFKESSIKNEELTFNNEDPFSLEVSLQQENNAECSLPLNIKKTESHTPKDSVIDENYCPLNSQEDNHDSKEKGDPVCPSDKEEEFHVDISMKNGKDSNQDHVTISHPNETIDSPISNSFDMRLFPEFLYNTLFVNNTQNSHIHLESIPNNQNDDSGLDNINVVAAGFDNDSYTLDEEIPSLEEEDEDDDDRLEDEGWSIEDYDGNNIENDACLARKDDDDDGDDDDNDDAHSVALLEEVDQALNAATESGLFETYADIYDMWLAKVVLKKFAKAQNVTVDDLIETVCDKLDALDSSLFHREDQHETLTAADAVNGKFLLTVQDSVPVDEISGLES